MNVNVRSLSGEHFVGWELTCSADAPNVYGKLLKAAHRLVKDLDPEFVSVTGITLNGNADMYDLTLIMSGVK